MVSTRHMAEMLLSLLALILVVVFSVLHVILGNEQEIWWMLAISTMLLALSDVIRRSKM